MDNQKFNVFTLAVDQMMNAQQHTRASIDNVYRFVLVMEVHAAKRPNAMVSIIMQCVNANQDMLAIQKLDVKLSVVEVTANVQRIEHVLTNDAKVHAIK